MNSLLTEYSVLVVLYQTKVNLKMAAIGLYNELQSQLTTKKKKKKDKKRRNINKKNRLICLFFFYSLPTLSGLFKEKHILNFKNISFSFASEYRIKSIFF